MGRVTASRGDARSSSDRKDARAKLNKHTINKVIPAFLQADARAKKGVDAAELIIDNASTTKNVKGTKGSKAVQGKSGRAGRKKGRRRNEDSSEDDEGSNNNTVTPTDKSSSGPTTAKDCESVSKASTSSFSVRILQCDVLAAAHSLAIPASASNYSTRNPKRGANVAILNMASPLRPGGGVLTGAMAQEESLCIRTTLYPSLKEEWYRLPEVGAIWTPDVCVFRDKDGKDLNKADRWFVDVISAAALRFPDVVEDISEPELQKNQETKGDDESIYDEEEDLSDDSGNDEDSDHEDDHSSASQEQVPRQRMKYASAKDRTLMISKMIAVLTTLSKKGTNSVVLGAWGCGAYGNPVSEIAKAWKTALQSKTQSWTSLKEVVFAIEKGRMAEEFAREFDEDMTVEVVRQTKVKQGLESEAEFQKWRERGEMEDKVQELEQQVAQTRFPELKARLELVLENLRLQLSNAQKTEESDD